MIRRRLLVLLAGAAVSQRIDRARDYPTTPVSCDDRSADSSTAGSAAPSDGAGAPTGR